MDDVVPPNGGTFNPFLSANGPKGRMPRAGGRTRAGEYKLILAGKVLFMVYMEAGEIPHIISVCLADTEEKRLYYGERNLQASG